MKIIDCIIMYFTLFINYIQIQLYKFWFDNYVKLLYKIIYLKFSNFLA